MNTAYHQTTPATQKELNDFEQINAAQDKRILDYLKKMYPGEYTAEDLYLHLPGPMLKTSIRRALSDLEEEGKIIRTGFKEGLFERKIGVYQAVV